MHEKDQKAAGHHQKNQDAGGLHDLQTTEQLSLTVSQQITPKLQAVLYEPPLLLYYIYMKPEIQHILDTIKQEYSHLDTILVFGSALTSDWTPKSDIDIFLIDDSFHDSRSEETIKDIAVELQKDNFKNLTKDIEAERGNLLHRNVSTMIAHSQTLSTKSPDKLNALINLAKDVLSSTPSYTDEDIKMWRYSIADYLSKAEKDVARNDALAFYLDANYVLQNALELSLATHHTHLPQPKHLAKLLQDKDPELSKIWQTYLSAPDLESKLQALSQLSVR